MQFTIVWSNKCNLSCDYCCVYDSLNKGSTITLKNVINFLDWQFSLYAEKNHTIEFFGGEPTLHMHEIEGLMSHIDKHYRDYTINYRIYTNCVFNNRVRNMEHVWSKFNEIICSIDGPFEVNQLRTPKLSTHTQSIDNFKHLLKYGTAGIAFVLHPESDIKKIFNYFKDMGCRYFHFEIASLWNDDIDNNISNNFLYNCFNFITDNILIHNSNNPDNYFLYSVPREFLSSDNFFNKSNKISCLDVMRSLSPKGNVYFCRDLAVSEYHLEAKSTAENLIFRESKDVCRPFNINNLQLDENNSYKESAKQYDMLTSCPVKSFEFIHLSDTKPNWILDKDFQDIVVYPMFELMNDTFSLHNQSKLKDINFFKEYQTKILFYKEVLNRYAELSTRL